MARKDLLKALLEYLGNDRCYKRMREKIEKELKNEYTKEGRGI